MDTSAHAVVPSRRSIRTSNRWASPGCAEISSPSAATASWSAGWMTPHTPSRRSRATERPSIAHSVPLASVMPQPDSGLSSGVPIAMPIGASAKVWRKRDSDSSSARLAISRSVVSRKLHTRPATSPPTTCGRE